MMDYDNYLYYSALHNEYKTALTSSCSGSSLAGHTNFSCAEVGVVMGGGKNTIFHKKLPKNSIFPPPITMPKK